MSTQQTSERLRVRPGWVRVPRSIASPERSWDALLVCVALYLATSVGRIHQLFPFLAPLRPTLVSGGLAIGLYLLSQDGARHARHVRAPTTTALLGFLLWAALSVPSALHDGAAFRMVVDNLAKSVLLYVLIVGCVRGMRDVERLCLVYLAAAVAYAAVVLTRFELGGAAWRLGSLYYYDANDLAVFAVTAIPLATYFVTTRRPPLLRVLSVLGLAALVAALVRSGSRGGFLALVATVGFLAIRYRGVPARWRALAVAGMAVVVLATASERYWQQMATITNPETDYNLVGEQGRLAIWKRGIGYMLQRPLFGVGADNFPVAEGSLSPLAYRQQYHIGVRWSAPHNSFIQVGAELGVPGLMLFLAILAATFAALARLQRPPPHPHRVGVPPLAASLTASLLGFAVGGFFLSLAYASMLYAVLAVAVALRKVALALRTC